MSGRASGVLDVTRYRPLLSMPALTTTYRASNAQSSPWAMPIWAGSFSTTAGPPAAPGVTRYSAPFWSEAYSWPFGSWHRATHDPWVSRGTAYTSSTANPGGTFMPAAGATGGADFFGRAWGATATTARSRQTAEPVTTTSRGRERGRRRRAKDNRSGGGLATGWLPATPAAGMMGVAPTRSPGTPPMPDPSRRDALALAALLPLAPEAPPGRHSIVHWCFSTAGERWDVPTAAQAAADLGCGSVELVDPQHWPTLAKHGLTCAIANGGFPKTGFKYGLNNPAHAGDVVAATRKRIGECAAAKVPSVIAFVGYKWPDPENPKSGEITRDDAFKSCVARLKELATDAEKAGVTVCVEHLNSRDATTPMTGHPGYQGDDLPFVCDILRAVGSPRVKLLFDIYHVQIMHGDLIRRVRECGELIGHVHTAGVPGRNELGDGQEINYPPVLKALADIGYRGYIGHEFIPTRDPRAGLREAIRLCTV